MSPYLRHLIEQTETEVKVALDPTTQMLSENNSVMTPKEREEYAAQLKTKAQTRQNEAKTVAKKVKRAERIWIPAEFVALVAFFLGLATLVCFAVLNT